MNSEIMKIMGFEKEMQIIEKNLCPNCLNEISPILVTMPLGDFRDELSIKKYKISGLCQKCQDKIFGK